MNHRRISHLLLPLAALAFLVAAVSPAPVSGQSKEPEFLWAVRAGGKKADKTRGLTTDAAGNVYMTGEFAEVADFGKHTLTSRGDYDFFVAKYSPAGECLWVRQGGGARTDRGYEVEVDRQGNVFVTGHYQSTDATFDGSPALPQRGDHDIFVARYDPQGKLQWVQTAGGEGYDYGHGIGVDGTGNCYVTGGVVGNNDFGGEKVENPVGSHLFVAKYAPSGKIAWVRQSRGRGAAGQALAVDRSGNCWATGSVSAEADFGGATYAATGRDVVLVKYDADGRALWATGAGGKSDGVATGVAVDDRGHSYIGGMFKSTAVFGNTTLSGSGDYDLFIAGFDPDGKPRWAHKGASAGIDYCLGIAADPKGGCYAVGEISGTATFSSTGSNAATTVPNAGGRDLYVARVEQNGTLSWVKPGGTEGDDLCYCVALDGKGHAYLSGAFNRTTRYGTASLTATGSNDIFLTQLRLR